MTSALLCRNLNKKRAFLFRPHSLPSPMSSICKTTPEPIRIGLIGCGAFARTQHLPNLTLSPSADFRWVCDLDRAIIETAATNSGAQGTTNYRDVLLDPEIEAIVIAVRDDLQSDLVGKALNAGKHVYVEKPGGTCPRKMSALHQEANLYRKRLQVGFQKRFAPAYQRARDLLWADGGVHNLYLRMSDDAWRWAIGYEPGSLIGHDICHHFDLAAYLTRSSIESVYALRSRPDDDAILLRMVNGSTVSVICSGHGTMDMPKERLEGISTRGGVRVEDFVELHSYGYPGEPARETFPLRLQPFHQPILQSLIKNEGAAELAHLRRQIWLARNKAASGRNEQEQAFSQLIPNFLRDQGWRLSLESFLNGIRDPDLFPEYPTMADAAQARAAADAAYLSLNSGLPEKPGLMNPPA